MTGAPGQKPHDVSALARCRAEPFAELSARAVAAINRALGLPAPVLVVAHGALFRSLRSAMGLPAHERLPNATPMWCEPDGAAWRLTAAA